MSLQRFSSFLCVLTLVLVGSLPLDAAAVKGRGAVSGSGTQVEYDHLNDPAYVEYKLKLADGEIFGITILNTLPNRFDYDIEAVSKPVPQVAATSRVRENQLKRYDTTRVHEKRYAGYLVHIKPKDGMEVPITRNDQSADALGNAELRIVVETMEVNYEMSGAFTATGLRDPVFAVEKKTENNVETSYVVRDRDAEDDQDLGLGAFIHVYHTRVKWLAGTFGLGVNDGSRTTYFAGPTLRFGDKAALTAGIAAGAVSRLPSGLAVGDPVTDANALATLGTRMGRSWFVGFSYTFLNPGNALTKPFAGQGNVPAAATPPGPTTPTPTPPTPTPTPTPTPPTPQPDPFAPTPNR